MTSKHRKIYAVFAVLVMALAALVVLAIPSATQDLDAAPGDSTSDPYVVNIVKGQSWVYDTTFPASLNPTVTIDKQGASFTATNGTYATVSGKQVTVTIPPNASVTEYYVAVKAATTNPTQQVFQYIKFVIKDVLTLTGPATQNGIKGTAFTSWTPVHNAPTGSTWSVSPGLPTGMSINASTGVISGTPSIAKAATTYTVQVSTTAPVQTKTTTVSIMIEDTLTATPPTNVYAAIGGVQDPASITVNLTAAKTFTVSSETLSNAASKVTINATTGAITVSGLVSGDAGTHTITVVIKMTGTGQQITKTFNLVIVDQLAYTSSPSAGYIVVG